MKKKKLSETLEVSALGFGCMGLSHAYGKPLAEDEAIHVLKEAVKNGYTFFDTAEIYGTDDDPFANERLLGKAFKDCREDVVIATKFGIRFDKDSGIVPFPLLTNSTPERIRESVEGSLKRLQTDYIDLYYQHRIDPNVEPEVVAGVMKELIAEGKIKAWGISEADGEYIKRADAVCHVTAVENRYSMMARKYEELFPLLKELNIALVAFSPMANGLLTGKYGKGGTYDKQYDYRSAMPQFTDEGMDENAKLLAFVDDLANKHNTTPAAISLAWMMNKDVTIVPIPGTRKVERLIENSKAADIVLDAKEVAEIDALLDKMPMSDVFGQAKK